MSKQAVGPPNADKPSPTVPPSPPPWRRWLLPIGLILSLVLFFLPTWPHPRAPQILSYSQFVNDVSHGQVATVEIAPNGGASGTLKEGGAYATTIPIGLAGPPLLSQLQAKGVQITATSPGPSLWSEILGGLLSFLPLILLGLVFAATGRRSSVSGGGGLLGGLTIGRARAKVFDTDRPDTTFANVAGYEGAKAEIAEVVEFLKDPDRFRQAGAVIPRGVLMVGPPGTGKTLLARAVAGEAGVPFISTSGSSFVEMFVGVGAARVRDLFAAARKMAPAIVFVDEIDAIGGRRAVGGAVVANDEREQTLNQLLAEMDGFDPAIGVVVLAATNRPEILDPALLRPGRFDRQVTVALPNQAERAAILGVHCRDKRLGPDVDLAVLARATPGFSGAELANLANEAAIHAVRHGRQVLCQADFDAARDRIILGRREDSNLLLPCERYAVAVHEAGHAIVAALSPNADPVERVTILPAGQSLGVTHLLPVSERRLYSMSWLLDSLAVRLGGRAAEKLVLGEASTGAANDLASATELAVKMVREYGLSDDLGPVSYQAGGGMYLPGGQEVASRPFAEATQERIDREVERLLRQAEQRARSLLERHRPALQRLTEALLEHETVDGATVADIVRHEHPVQTGSARSGESLGPEVVLAAERPVPGGVTPDRASLETAGASR
jgi:cell division protease FtsH